jgi:hypothetical protein
MIVTVGSSGYEVLFSWKTDCWLKIPRDSNLSLPETSICPVVADHRLALALLAFFNNMTVTWLNIFNVKMLIT